MKLFLSACALCALWSRAAASWRDEGVTDLSAVDLKAEFRDWKQEFGKSYADVHEEAHRFLVWTDNWRFIVDHNRADYSYTMKLNQFGDLTGDEFRLAVHGHTGSCLAEKADVPLLSALNPRRLQNLLGKKKEEKQTSAAPTSIDWTTKGVVTPVKNQGSCGSCWAFSTTGSTECRYAIATGTLNSLSEQELVDCSRSYGNEGCDGGLMDYGFEYVKANDGLCSEDEYPYKGVDGTCKKEDCSTRYNPISGYTDVTSDDEDALMAAVADGCVSVAVEADQSSFQFYSGGVLTGRCGTSLDHGVLVVGYGTEGGEEYWKVKNSWGESWGMDGYLLICRDCDENGKEGECGIDMEPSYPIAQS